nr:FeoB-associated Cys-rich membrane protein [uncultured Blautia sp.]
MANFIVAAILLAAVGMAVAHIVKAKKRGVKCIGCPSGGCCGGKKDGSSGCGCGCQEEK